MEAANVHVPNINWRHWKGIADPIERPRPFIPNTMEPSASLSIVCSFDSNALPEFGVIIWFKYNNS